MVGMHEHDEARGVSGAGVGGYDEARADDVDYYDAYVNAAAADDVDVDPFRGYSQKSSKGVSGQPLLAVLTESKSVSKVTPPSRSLRIR